MNPASWSSADVQDWARRKGLPDSTATALAENEVDGPTLLTLDREELRADLGITSLPARRFLYELILSLRSHQITADRTRAIDVLEEEIDSLQSGGAELSAHHCADPTVVEVLRSDAEIQRKIISDHLVALRLHSSSGQQFYEDKQFAQDESERYNQLAIQSEFDRRYAQSLEGNRRGRTRSNDFDDDNSTIASLFGLTIETCVKNKVNVAEALANGTIKIIPRYVDATSDLVSTDEFVDPEESLRQLPTISSCMVCYDENIQGFSLACGQHSICIDCARNLFQSAVKDTSLLPLRCCDVPIDMNASSWLLSPEDSNLIHTRMYEMSAREKMYCPSCNRFINLDLVEAQDTTELICICSAGLCINCKTLAHPGTSCADNKLEMDENDKTFMLQARDAGWKQCPGCSAMIELVHGCNHITCACDHEFCYRCLAPWGGDQCSSGQCDVWDEDRLIAAGEARVNAEENRLQRDLPAPVRQARLQRAMRELQANEGCLHEWVRRGGHLGNCERCNYFLPVYGMRCVAGCGSTVCYTCASFRIPSRGWR